MNGRQESMSHTTDFHCVFPPYGIEFREMGGVVEHWEQALPEPHRFRPGFHGGGVLTIFNTSMSNSLINRIRMNCFASINPPYGLVLGNASGRLLTDRVRCVFPDRPPVFAVKAGYAEYVPEMSVAVTAEHLDGLGDRRYGLVVPKVGRRSVKGLEQLPEWFSHFGVTVQAPSSDELPALREHMTDWFGDPTRLLFAFPMSGGEADPAWQLAVVCYVAQHWETQAKGIQAVHYVAEIEGEPNFRKNWTSNK